jgi:hypothetical protein
MRIASDLLWILVIPMLILALAILQAVSPPGGSSPAAEHASGASTPAVYVSGGGAKPAAASVDLPEPAAAVETF